MAGTSPAMTRCVVRTIVPLWHGLSKKFFTDFVDRKFTTSIQAPFTRIFNAIAASAAIACLCRAGHAD
jgi:hypothetical protein